MLSAGIPIYKLDIMSEIFVKPNIPSLIIPSATSLSRTYVPRLV